ncbi:hypothetical protein HYH02_007726 [Chlamydomonas schloesseri]|uniref:Uncharacterized protein n=1 Tax=Chlamydomonas schloesseri TaxID=2026947 RepID=A0A836B4X2_9CHLO|nr:hypothetical protein HYH02_007726 [Chlamydomonas schloesseri]|eukprot:KAG2447399.1 hypothetical protein HYH02_007726 [Chlamydomonas schloesseri]
MPPRLYEQVLSPAIIYWCRVTPYLGILLAGPHTDPSAVTLVYLQKCHVLTVLHLVLFATLLGVWEVDARVELAACLLEAACALTCLSWHGAKVPGGPPHPAALLAGRALVPLVNLGLAYAAGRWRPGGGVGRGRRTALGAQNSMLGSGSAAGSSKERGQGLAKGCTHGGADVDDGGQVAQSLDLPETGAADPVIKDDGAAGPSGAVRLWSSAVGPAGPTAPVPLLRQEAQHGGSGSGSGSGAAAPPILTPVAVLLPPAEQCPEGGGADAVVAAAPRPPVRPYQSLIRRRTTHHYKIPWADPEDIAPGFEERLAALYAARGLAVTGMHVRAGCIELTVAAVDYSRLLGGAGAGGRGGGGGGGGGGGTATSPALLHVSAAEVIAALGLSLPASASSPAAGKDRLGAAALQPYEQPPALQVVSVQRDSMGAATAGQHDARSPDAVRPQQSRLVGVSPRVLLLPPPPSMHAPAADASGTAAPQLRLRVAFSGGAGPAAADDVVVRCGSGYLAVRVAAKQLSAADEGEAVGAQEWEYAVELVEPPPHPQLLTVQLAFPAAAATAAGGAGDTHNAPVQWLSVPVLAVDDAAVAAELGSELLQQQQEQQDASSACMEELVCDLGQWLAAASGADEGTVDAGAGCRFSAEWVSELGAHLLEYAEGAGLVATAARIREGAGQLAGDGAADMKNQTKQAKKDEPAGDQGLRRRGPLSKAAEMDGKGAVYQNGACSFGDAESSSGRKGSVGGANHSAASRDSSLREYTDRWIVTTCTTGQLMECLMAAAFTAKGLKEGQSLWSREAAVVYTALGVGTLATLAGLWMAPAARSRLALAARIPRYAGALLSKALVAAGLLPPPVGSVTYSGGVGVLLLEGVILPSGCLLPPRMQLLLCCMKLPLNAVGSHAAGAFRSLMAAALQALAVEATAMATTLTFHRYVKLQYQRLQQRQRQRATPA